MSAAPPVSSNTAMKVCAAPLPAAGVTDVLVTTAGAGTVHEPSCCQPLEPALPVAEIHTCLTPLYADLSVSGIESTRLFELTAARTPAPATEHCVFWIVPPAPGTTLSHPTPESSASLSTLAARSYTIMQLLAEGDA